MIHERRASQHTNHRHLALVREIRDQEDRIEPVRDRRYTPSSEKWYDEAPVKWADADTRKARRDRYHTVLMWAATFGWGIFCGYVIFMWLTE